ncbi:hypothetical protein K469DRAFT_712966, partial [Zopfia rhizophila CBS 207.26]
MQAGTLTSHRRALHLRTLQWELRRLQPVAPVRPQTETPRQAHSTQGSSPAQAVVILFSLLPTTGGGCISILHSILRYGSAVALLLVLLFLFVSLPSLLHTTSSPPRRLVSSRRSSRLCPLYPC